MTIAILLSLLSMLVALAALARAGAAARFHERAGQDFSELEQRIRELEHRWDARLAERPLPSRPRAFVAPAPVPDRAPGTAATGPGSSAPAPPVIGPSSPVAPVKAAPGAVPAMPVGQPVYATAESNPSEWGAVDLERFMGVRLFAWLGGLALFLGVACFVKFSFDRDLLSPSARVAIGLLSGLGLIGGGIRLGQRAYAVTSQTLCGTGVVILYASLFAGHARYDLPWLPQWVTFGCMSAVTAGAFLLAVRMHARVVAILGVLGGFLTPILLSSGQASTAALFTYIGLLDAGLLAIAVRCRWSSLAPMGAGSTVVLQLLWTAERFHLGKGWVAWAIFCALAALFVTAFMVDARQDRPKRPAFAAATIVMGAWLLFMGAWLITPAFGDAHPALPFAFVLAADLILLTVLLWHPAWAVCHVAGGLAAFGLITAWQAQHARRDMIGWALVLILGFALLHSVVPLVIARKRGATTAGAASPDVGFAPWFPALATGILIVPIVSMAETSFAIWPVILLLNLVALFVAFTMRTYAGALAALLITMVVNGVWISRLSERASPPVAGTLTEVALMAALFAGAAGFLARRAWRESGADGNQAVALAVTAMAMPFVLLSQLVIQLPMPDPSGPFAAALVIVLIAMGLAGFLRVGLLPPIVLGGISMVQVAWLENQLPGAGTPLRLIGWSILVVTVFTIAPVAWKALGDLRLMWPTAALAGIPQFYFVYQVMERFWPGRVNGLLPLAFAIPPCLLLTAVCRSLPDPFRNERIAWWEVPFSCSSPRRCPFSSSGSGSPWDSGSRLPRSPPSVSACPIADSMLLPPGSSWLLRCVHSSCRSTNRCSAEPICS